MSNYKSPFNSIGCTATPHSIACCPRSREAGLTLVELLVALALGLVLLTGVVNIFMTTRQTFRVNENLAHVQENSRLAFELLVREVRESGSTPCGTRAMANVVRIAGGVPWWADWDMGTARGFDGNQDSDLGMKQFGTASTERVPGTDAILSLRIASDESRIKLVSNHAGLLFDVPSVTGYAVGDLLAACDPASGALVQVSTVNTTPTFQIGYALAGLNCSTDLGFPRPAVCTPPGAGIPKTFIPGTILTKFDPVFWYVGFNPAGRRSLYRTNVRHELGVVTVRSDEMVPGVRDMQIEYLTRDSLNADLLATTWVTAADNVFAPAAFGWTVDNRNQAVAVRITLTLVSEDNVRADSQPLERKFVAVAALRARDIP